MTDDRARSESIREVLGLDGDVRKLDAFYEGWATSYNTDTAAEGYRGPRALADVMEAHVHPAADDRIIDAGCGTGLVGEELYRRGLRCIDGFDLSRAMVAEAARLNVYGRLHGGIDLNRPITEFPAESYDVAVSCGVFTSGHVPPPALMYLLALVKPGGLCVVSARESYSRETGFAEYCRERAREGDLTIVACHEGHPYTAHESAQYWVLQAGLSRLAAVPPAHG